jgi:hypothetical protein
VIACRAQHNEPVYILLAHTLEDVRHGLGEHVCFFPGAGAQRGENRAVTANGIYYCPEIEYVSLNHPEMRVLRQSIGVASKNTNCVPLSQRLGNN